MAFYTLLGREVQITKYDILIRRATTEGAMHERAAMLSERIRTKDGTQTASELFADLVRRGG
jgi:hypothetical protein